MEKKPNSRELEITFKELEANEYEQLLYELSKLIYSTLCQFQTLSTAEKSSTRRASNA